MVHTCSTCLKDFARKSQYDTHLARKNPCKASSTVAALKAMNPAPTETTQPFRPLSLKLNKELTKEERQAGGIFFTPHAARRLILDTIKSNQTSASSLILEPSFGSGEFLEDAATLWPQANLVGCELNTKAFTAFNERISPRMTIHNTDFMTWASPVQFDTIIGNPPYLVIKEKNPLCMTGRPNLYVAFLYKCLTEHLLPGGLLGFVLPTSLYNCSYYEPMRKYIAEHCSVILLKSLDVKYYQTEQDTMAIVIKKIPDPIRKYIYEKNGSIYLLPQAKELTTFTASTDTIHSLGCSVRTGDVVWNQERDKLVATPGEGATILLYDTNIKSGTVTLSQSGVLGKDTDKRQYIKGFRRAARKGPAILVTRGHGNNYQFGFAWVPAGMEFYAENHVNMILGPEEPLNRILASLGDARTAEFIQQFVGSGAISKTELEFVVPIWRTT